MKKKTSFSLIGILVMVIIAAGAFAVQWDNYDMADYGTSAAVTNSASEAVTLTSAVVTYDAAATTNTLAIYVNKGGIDYRIGTNTLTDGKYTTIDLTDIVYKSGDILKITTTDTNVNILVKSE